MGSQQLTHRAALVDKDVSVDLERLSYTVDDCLDRCGIHGAFHWLLLLYCGVSWACDAMEVMILSYLGPAVACEWGLTAAQESLLASVVFIGMCLGAPFWGMMSDAVGRKMSFLGAMTCTTVFGFATAAAPSYLALLACRCLVGFGIPAAGVAFNWLLEFTPTRYRGVFAVAIEGFWTVGTLLQAGMAYGLLNRYGWRLLVTVSAIPFVPMLLFIVLVPESPRYLLVKGKLVQAEQILIRVSRLCKAEMPEGKLQPVRSSQHQQTEALVIDQQTGGCQLLRVLRCGAAGVWTALKQLLSGKLGVTTCVLIFTWMVSAFVYYGLVSLVAQLDFVDGGGHKRCQSQKLIVPTSDLTAILITSSAEVPGLIFSLVTVFFLSRKVAFAVPLALITVVLIPPMAGLKGPGLLVCMYLSRFFIYSSFNILWTMTPEYYPTSIRTFALGLTNSFSRIGGVLSPFAALNAGQRVWQNSPQAIFAALSLVAAGSVFMLPPDKKNKNLNDCLDDVSDVPAVQHHALPHVHSYTYRSSSSAGHRRSSLQGADECTEEEALNRLTVEQDAGLIAPL